MRKPLLLLIFVVMAGFHVDASAALRKQPSLSPLSFDGSQAQSGSSQNSTAQGKEGPLDLEQIKELINLLPDTSVARLIVRRGINFRLNEETMEDLRRSGMGREALAALHAFMSNRPPSVVLRASKTSLMPGERMTLTADINDPDGDKLQLRWLSNAGKIIGDGLSIEFDSSGVDISAGPLEITVSITVSDLKGGFASDSKSVTVAIPQAEAESREGSENISPPEADAKMALAVGSEGKYMIVSLTGNSGSSSSSPIGSIEVHLKMNNGIVEVKDLTGILPGRPCRVDFTGIKNVAEGSFKEPPGIANRWSTVTIRFRIKDPKREAHFVIGWKVLDEPFAR